MATTRTQPSNATGKGNASWEQELPSENSHRVDPSRPRTYNEFEMTDDTRQAETDFHQDRQPLIVQPARPGLFERLDDRFLYNDLVGAYEILRTFVPVPILAVERFLAHCVLLSQPTYGILCFSELTTLMSPDVKMTRRVMASLLDCCKAANDPDLHIEIFQLIRAGSFGILPDLSMWHDYLSAIAALHAERRKQQHQNDHGSIDYSRGANPQMQHKSSLQPSIPPASPPSVPFSQVRARLARYPLPIQIARAVEDLLDTQDTVPTTTTLEVVLEALSQHDEYPDLQRIEWAWNAFGDRGVPPSPFCFELVLSAHAVYILRLQWEIAQRPADPDLGPAKVDTSRFPVFEDPAGSPANADRPMLQTEPPPNAPIPEHSRPAEDAEPGNAPPLPSFSSYSLFDKRAKRPKLQDGHITQPVETAKRTAGQRPRILANMSEHDQRLFADVHEQMNGLMATIKMERIPIREHFLAQALASYVFLNDMNGIFDCMLLFPPRGGDPTPESVIREMKTLSQGHDATTAALSSSVPAAGLSVDDINATQSVDSQNAESPMDASEDRSLSVDRSLGTHPNCSRGVAALICHEEAVLADIPNLEPARVDFVASLLMECARREILLPTSCYDAYVSCVPISTAPLITLAQALAWHPEKGSPRVLVLAIRTVSSVRQPSLAVARELLVLLRSLTVLWPSSLPAQATLRTSSQAGLHQSTSTPPESPSSPASVSDSSAAPASATLTIADVVRSLEYVARSCADAPHLAGEAAHLLKAHFPPAWRESGALVRALAKCVVINSRPRELSPQHGLHGHLRHVRRADDAVLPQAGRELQRMVATPPDTRPGGWTAVRVAIQEQTWMDVGILDVLHGLGVEPDEELKVMILESCGSAVQIGQLSSSLAGFSAFSRERNEADGHEGGANHPTLPKSRDASSHGEAARIRAVASRAIMQRLGVRGPVVEPTMPGASNRVSWRSRRWEEPLRASDDGRLERESEDEGASGSGSRWARTRDISASSPEVAGARALTWALRSGASNAEASRLAADAVWERLAATAPALGAMRIADPSRRALPKELVERLRRWIPANSHPDAHAAAGRIPCDEATSR
jgi:hypothetical protein